MDAVAQLRARATELNLELKAVAAACLAYVAAYHAREDEVLLLLPGVDAGPLEVHDIDDRLERIETLLRHHGITNIRRSGGYKAFGEHRLWVVAGARE